MRVLLLQLDGFANEDDPDKARLPNLACLRIAGHHRERGDEVVFRCVEDEPGQLSLWDRDVRFDRVYASLIFEKTKPVARQVLEAYPGAILGGTGWDVSSRLEAWGVGSRGPLDWSIYPSERRSVGFTQRGCGLKCGFCVVPRKEGPVREEQNIRELWRGDPWPRDLVLLDNDPFGQPAWRERFREIRDGRFRVSFTQGFNVRLSGAKEDGSRDLRKSFGDEEAQELASLDYWADNFKKRRLYCAWDNRGDEEKLFHGLEALARAGVPPSRVMVYMLVGYWRGPSLNDDDFYRARRLREWGADPYPMPFVRTPELVGFQRWVARGHDKRKVSWADWVEAKYQPRNLATETADTEQVELFR